MTKREFFCFCSLCGQPLAEGESLIVTPEKTLAHRRCYQKQLDAQAEQFRQELRTFKESFKEA